MLDRTISPKIQSIQDIKPLIPKEIQFPNGVMLYAFNASEQALVKIDWVFDAGSIYAKNVKLALIVNKLLTEGTQSKTADEISLIVDYCGASLRTDTTKEKASLSLTVLHKHVDQMLELVSEILHEASLPEEELQLYLARKTQELHINKQKVSFVARDSFPSLLYGTDHSYGRPSELEDYLSVTPKMLQDFYAQHYANRKPLIFVSGSVNDNLIQKLEQFFGQNKISKHSIQEAKIFNSSSQLEHKVLFKDAVQNALRIGRLWPNRTHQDYVGLQALVTLFGGYFGSRLMTNIREDKGYTYGIGAGVKHFKSSSFMFIGTEVKAENYMDVIREIEVEVDKLKQNKVSIEELNLVKSVMQGAFQRGFDGPFAQADRFKELIYNDLDMNYYELFLKKLKEIDVNQIQDLAQDYLNIDEFYKLIVGKF
jgi:zinc protease